MESPLIRPNGRTFARSNTPGLSLVALALAGSFALAGCAVASLAPEPPATPATSSAAATIASPSPSTPTIPTVLSPFTGLPTQPNQPVLLVKMDNTTYAQPHAGLTAADLVYLEPVEYGMTRIAAVFSSTIPTRIGPVRSARITDIDLAAQFGEPALAFSGAQHRMYPVLQSAPINLVSPTVAGKGFTRDKSRRAPYNLFLDGTVALTRAPEASTATDIGLTFSPLPPPGGRPATHARVVWPSSSATFNYNSVTGLYEIKLNGSFAGAEEDSGRQHAASVIIQFVNTPDSVFHDKFGGITPRAEVVGSGTGVILRDGLAFDVTWSRPSASAHTIYTLSGGQPMPLKPGQVWIPLASVTREQQILASIGTSTGSDSASAYASASASANASGAAPISPGAPSSSRSSS